jgi:HK97 family phage major capsid protein
MNLAQLQAQRKEKRDLAQSILSLAKAEGRDAESLNEDESAKFDAYMNAADDLTTQIDAAEVAGKRLERAQALKDDQDAATQSQGRKSSGQISDVKLASESDPMGGFGTPRDFIQSVLKNSRPGKIKDERLYPFNAAVGSDEQAGFDDPLGGYTIPKGFSPEVKELAPEEDFISPRVTSLPMNSPRVDIPARVDKNHSTSVSGGLTVTRRPEATDGTSSLMTLEQIAMQTNMLFGLSYVTEELLQDSAVSFAALIARGFSQEMTSHLIDERINGSGVGEFMGIRNSPSIISVAKEAGQAADTIVRENIVNMRSRCWGYNNAIWMANDDCYPALHAMTLDVGTGGQGVYQPSVVEDRPDMLLGRPIFYTEYAETLGDAGDIVLANWGEYLEGTYETEQSAESVHVRFISHERTFKFWVRNAGMPWWSSALTPKNSAITKSPFLQLDARA